VCRPVVPYTSRQNAYIALNYISVVFNPLIIQLAQYVSADIYYTLFLFMDVG